MKVLDTIMTKKGRIASKQQFDCKINTAGKTYPKKHYIIVPETLNELIKIDEFLEKLNKE